VKTYEVVAQELSHHDVRTVFGLMGDANLAYIGAYIESGAGEFIAAVAEGSAVSMADGFHRMNGGVAVASVTHGPALTNTLTALTEAVRARSHVLLITGDTPDMHHHFQSLDIEGFARGAGAGYLRVRHPDDVAADIASAFQRIVSENRPLVLDVPYDLLERTAEYTQQRLPRRAFATAEPNEDAIDEALGILLAASRPIVLAGRGAVNPDARAAILRLARLIGAPVTTTLLAKDLFAEEPENAGIHGNLANSVAAEEIGKADCLISFGASLNTFTTDGNELLRGKSVIAVDSRPEAIGRFAPVTLGLVGDAARTASAMCERLEQAGHTFTDSVRMADIRNSISQLAEKTYRSITGSGTVDMRDAMARLTESLPAGAQIVTDVGRFSFAAWLHLKVNPGRFTVPGTFGSIGLGIATAIGAAAARPEVLTVCVAGDGGAMMGLTELCTAVRHSLPLVLVILNDNCYGAEYGKLESLGLKTVHSEVRWPEFAEVARALGADALTIREPEDFDAVRVAVNALTRPLVIEVKADPARRRPTADSAGSQSKVSV
jgi:thiamine pyrophosphate-dependent acetolactate synthase large subunit-like protein